MAFQIKDIDQSEAPLLDHLIELRSRLVRCIIAIALAFAVCLYFADEIFGFLVRPLTAAFPEGQGKLIYTQLYEAFFVELKVALFAAFFISFPVIANQLWAFVAPGLYAREKKAFLPFLFATPILFVGGAALAYYVVRPPLPARPYGARPHLLHAPHAAARSARARAPALAALPPRVVAAAAAAQSGGYSHPRATHRCQTLRDCGGLHPRGNRHTARSGFTDCPGDPAAAAVRRLARDHVAGRATRFDR
ncbi:MAG: hypothetical protein B7X57_01355 [Erythrobacter sp. 34-65-8]|nr:MAG: hypothetical protein B7X57_01355 [Erythrobacter sp. 34-65-8]